MRLSIRRGNKIEESILRHLNRRSEKVNRKGQRTIEYLVRVSREIADPMGRLDLGAMMTLVDVGTSLTMLFFDPLKRNHISINLSLDSFE